MSLESDRYRQTFSEQVAALPDGARIGDGFMLCRDVVGGDAYARLAEHIAGSGLNAYPPTASCTGEQKAGRFVVANAPLLVSLVYAGGGDIQAVADRTLKDALLTLAEEMPGITEPAEVAIGGLAGAFYAVRRVNSKLRATLEGRSNSHLLGYAVVGGVTEGQAGLDAERQAAWRSLAGEARLPSAREAMAVRWRPGVVLGARGVGSGSRETCLRAVQACVEKAAVAYGGATVELGPVRLEREHLVHENITPLTEAERRSVGLV